MAATNKTERNGKSNQQKSDPYPRKLLSGLHCLLKSKDFCDIKVCVSNQTFSAHKNILAAASPYFHAMFTSGMTEQDKDCVEIKCISPDIFEKVLQFIYTGDDIFFATNP